MTDCPATTAAETVSDVPLCVDLDGTLLRSDMLLETLLVLIKSQPYVLILLPFWLFKGKANLKSQIANRIDFDCSHVPLNEDVLEFVRSERGHRKLYLVTGTNQELAQGIADRIGVFDEVMGSTPELNLTNHRKRALLEQRFGKDGFDYIGNDEDDLNVWPSARKALVVSTADSIAIHSAVEFDRVFETPKTGLRDYLSLLRVHQWSKNGLLAVPFCLDHRMQDASGALSVALAFVAMSLLASATYILNDMLDLHSDRQNATKSKRVLASGKMPIMRGVQVIMALVLGFFCISLLLPPLFNAVMLIYLITTLTYTFLLKKKAVIDVISLAALHTLRVIAGTVVIQAAFSFWLLGFSMFIFFSLACAKRVAELINLQQAGREATVGRDYRVADIPVMLASGVSTGFISVMVVALYINSDKVLTLYSNPMILWLLCPLLMYWIGRIWLRTARGEMHEDPIVFALRDKVSLLTVLLLGNIVFVATLFKANLL